jgi:AcrR family transcriptional regulator
LTEKRILDAAQAVILERGFNEVGINSVAQRAGVAKELIYRYFGSISNLILTAIEPRDFWLPERIERFIDRLSEISFEKKVATLVLAHSRSLRRDPQAREIRRWEMMSSGEVTTLLAARREMGGRIVARLLSENSTTDPAAFGIIFAGLSYLILRSTTLESYLGIDLASDQAWERWESAAVQLVRSVCSEPVGLRRSSPQALSKSRARSPSRG